MSRYGGNNRSSADDLAYGDYPPQRWDRDRFERFGRGPPPGPRYEEEYRYTERDRPGRRDITVADRVEDRGPRGHVEERDRYVEVDRSGPARPRRRTDRELFGDVDPREIADMALTPYRRKSISRHEVELDRPGPPRPSMIRRQSSLDTFDRRPVPRYEKDEYRMPPYTPVPLPIKRPEGARWGREDDWEEVRNSGWDEPEDYREVEIQRERSVHRRRPSAPRSEARSEVKSVKSKTTKSVRESIHEEADDSSESFEEVEKEESIHESIHSEASRRFKKGKTRMPKRLVRREAIMDLGYPFDEEEGFFVLRIALEKEQIDEVIRISETYKDGERQKKIYRFEETVEETSNALALPPQTGEREEVLRTEWVNPPTVIMSGARSERARSIRASSPGGRSTTTRRVSPARTQHTSHSRARSRRPSSPGGTLFEDRRTLIEEHVHSPPPPPMPAPPSGFPPPGAIPVPPTEYLSEHRTVIEERSPSRHGGALVVQEREWRSDRDIQSEIRALEAERRALRLEREAEEKRDMAIRLRERPEEDFQLVEYRERRPREVLEVVERERSPPRNVVRVEKDRKERRKARIVAAAMATLT